jgi:NAD(P)-dependent dehydrogenase (short-subunit alcohol dehydrogenase family)
MGKTCLITGATAGIGKEAARALTAQGFRIVLVSRDRGRGEKAIEKIRPSAPGAQVELIMGDLASQRSIRKIATDFEDRFDRLDVLINNAGAWYPERTLTIDGIEATFATNHLAYFLLTGLLTPLLKRSAPSRIVNVASEAHRWARLDFDDLQGAQSYGGWSAYSKSKLANILFTHELARRLDRTGVTANCLHPGTVRTELFRNLSGITGAAIKLATVFFRSPKKGAETTVYLASSPEVQGVSGKYFADCKEARSNEASYDEAAALRLWEMSEELTHLCST